MARTRRVRLATIKVGIQKADSNLTLHGGGTAPLSFNVMETEGGARPLAGQEQTIKESATTGEVCNVGDIIKYVNLFIQSGPRSDSTTPAENVGWIEWAFVMVKESEAPVLITNIGTLTLGTICTNMYRNECIYTGQFPLGLNQSNSQQITIKVPKFKQKIRRGDEWRFIHWFRSTNSTNDDLNNCHTIKSFLYKCYS